MRNAADHMPATLHIHSYMQSSPLAELIPASSSLMIAVNTECSRHADCVWHIHGTMLVRAEHTSASQDLKVNKIMIKVL